MINNKIKLYILGVPMNKLGNWLIAIFLFFVFHCLLLHMCLLFIVMYVLDMLLINATYL